MSWITLHVPGAGGGKSEAAVGNFLNGKLNMRDSCQLNVGYYAKKEHRMLVAETKRLHYVGQSEGATSLNAPSNSKYFIGMLDKKAGTMNIYNTRLFNLKPTIPETVKTEEEEVDSRKTMTPFQLMDQLTSTFGSRMKKRALSSRQKNLVSGDVLEVAVSSAAASAIENPQFLESLVVPKQDATASAIPPYNKDAEEARDIYPINGIIGPSEFEALKAPAAIWIKGEILDKDTNFLYVREHLRSLPLHGEARTRRTCYLLYIEYMMSMYMMSARDIQRKHPLPGHVPDVLKKFMLDSFTLTSTAGIHLVRFRPMKMRDKIVAYILVLCLIVDEFTLEYSTLQVDLKLTDQKLVMYLRALGCKIHRAQTTREDGSSRTVGVGTLTAPLKFPEISFKRKKATR